MRYVKFRVSNKIEVDCFIWLPLIPISGSTLFWSLDLALSGTFIRKQYGHLKKRVTSFWPSCLDCIGPSNLLRSWQNQRGREMSLRSQWSQQVHSDSTKNVKSYLPGILYVLPGMNGSIYFELKSYLRILAEEELQDTGTDEGVVRLVTD